MIANMQLRAGVVLVSVLCVITLIGCKPEESAADEPDDGRLDCDAPSAEIVDVEWRSELRVGSEPGTSVRTWYLQSAEVRLTNNTRHGITTSGVTLTPDYKTEDGSDAPGERFDWVNIPDHGFTEIPTAGIDGHDSRGFSDDNLNRRLGRTGEQPPPLKASPTSWQFSNHDLEEACSEQGRDDRLRDARTVTLVPRPAGAPYTQLGHSRDELKTSVRFDYCAKPGDIAIDKDKIVAITESGLTLTAATISETSAADCFLYFGVFISRSEHVLRLEYPTDSVPFTWVLGP